MVVCPATTSSKWHRPLSPQSLGWNTSTTRLKSYPLNNKKRESNRESGVRSPVHPVQGVSKNNFRINPCQPAAPASERLSLAGAERSAFTGDNDADTARAGGFLAATGASGAEDDDRSRRAKRLRGLPLDARVRRRAPAGRGARRKSPLIRGRLQHGAKLHVERLADERDGLVEQPLQTYAFQRPLSQVGDRLLLAMSCLQLRHRLLVIGDIHQDADGARDVFLAVAQRIDAHLEGPPLPLHLV